MGMGVGHGENKIREDNPFCHKMCIAQVQLRRLHYWKPRCMRNSVGFVCLHVMSEVPMKCRFHRHSWLAVQKWRKGQVFYSLALKYDGDPQNPFTVMMLLTEHGLSGGTQLFPLCMIVSFHLTAKQFSSRSQRRSSPANYGHIRFASSGDNTVSLVGTWPFFS